MSDYIENVQRIVEVGWATEKMQVFTWPTVADANNGELGTFIPYPADRVLESATAWKKKWKGDTSGAEIDLSNLPAAGGQIVIVPPFFAPPCTFTWINAYDLAGSAVTTFPNTGFSITTLQFSALTFYTATWTGSVCASDGNAPSLTGYAFVDGETLSPVED